MGDHLIDAKAAGELLGVPHTWVFEQARHDRIPHIRLGRYVRFEADAVLAWARNRSRGPTYALSESKERPRRGCSRPRPDTGPLGGPMQDDPTRRRSYGTGSLTARANRNGVEVWDG